MTSCISHSCLCNLYFNFTMLHCSSTLCPEKKISRYTVNCCNWRKTFQFCLKFYIQVNKQVSIYDEHCYMLHFIITEQLDSRQRYSEYAFATDNSSTSRAFHFGQKKFRFDSIRFSLPNRFFRFDSIRQSDKFAACRLHWYSNSKLGVIFIVCIA